MAVTWTSVKMSYHWQINWEVQKIKWTICKRIRFSPLHSIVQPVLLFLSEWTGKVVPTTSTSVAVIVILRGALGRDSNNQNENLRCFFHEWGGGLEFHITILKNYFFWKSLRIIPWLWKRVLNLVWALYYVYIVVEMTLNMAK